MKIDLDITQKVASNGVLSLYKDGKEIAQYASHNAIMSEGFNLLRTKAVNTILNMLVMIRQTRGDPVAVNNRTAAYPNYALGTVHQEPCCDDCTYAGALFVSSDSFIEGWDSTKDADVLTVAGDYSYWDLTRTWSIDPAVFFGANRVATISQNRQIFNVGVDSVSGEETDGALLGKTTGGAGGRLDGITHFAILEDYNRVQMGLPNECLFFEEGSWGPHAPPANESQFFIHPNLAPLWNHGQFVDAHGAPTPVDFEAGITFKFHYTVRVYVPAAPIVQVINVHGVDVTCTTRAHAVHDPNWSPLLLNNISPSGQTTMPTAYESSAMPALNAYVGGSGDTLTSCIASSPAGVDYREAIYVWDTPKANFATGVGAITHWQRNTAGTPVLITTFAPKIPKTVNRKLTVQARYGWALAGGV